MGSGEMSPGMAAVHADLIRRVGASGRAMMLDTSYGFQENAGEISQRASAYFREKVGHPIRIASLGDRESIDPLALERLYNQLREARLIFAGPGSPSYALRQWRDSQVPELLARRLRDGGCLTFASAAAISLGRFALPVYEIYKVGERAHWLEGLDLLGPVGFDVIIPHYDNAEGGTHDTRYCYMGERRLRQLEQQLPSRTTIFGVAEHTAGIVDLEARTLEVRGRGFVAIRQDGVERRYRRGGPVSLDEVLRRSGGSGARAVPRAAAALRRQPWSSPERAGDQDVDTYQREFDRALDGSDADAAIRAVLDLDNRLASWRADGVDGRALDRARSVYRGMLVRLGEILRQAMAGPREPVAPLVELALRLRDDARRNRRYPEADLVRDALQELGIEVRDTRVGSEWRRSARRPERSGGRSASFGEGVGELAVVERGIEATAR
jgi:cyanophycinase-like exopeptidase